MNAAFALRLTAALFPSLVMRSVPVKMPPERKSVPKKSCKATMQRIKAEKETQLKRQGVLQPDPRIETEWLQFPYVMWHWKRMPRQNMKKHEER
jgi:hypothetical protein